MFFRVGASGVANIFFMLSVCMSVHTSVHPLHFGRVGVGAGGWVQGLQNYCNLQNILRLGKGSD